MNIEAYDIDSLRKLVRSLQNENTVLKAQLQKANIPYTILRFIASQNNSILPYHKYLTKEAIDKSSLAKREKEKLENRLIQYRDLDTQVDLLKFKEVYDSLDEIKVMHMKPYHEAECVAYNIDRIGIDNVKQYIIDELQKIKENGEITVPTWYRRLALIYDFKKYS